MSKLKQLALGRRSRSRKRETRRRTSRLREEGRGGGTSGRSSLGCLVLSVWKLVKVGRAEGTWEMEEEEEEVVQVRKDKVKIA